MANATAYFDSYAARRLLERHSAHRSTTACFVNPNARCPVCGDPVFYYQNAFGSRVFFDELGPPWPKHPCTDQKPQNIGSGGAAFERPIRRARGLMLELVEAAQKAASEGNAVAESAEATPWTLMEASEIHRSGWRNDVLAEFIGADTKKWIKFSFDSANETMKMGDIFNLRDSEISLFDLIKMKPRTYKITIIENNVTADDRQVG
ncbi:hypothetical protein [Hyphomicrobium sp.]|uniref:hypothetical protein n=1 Tax=Hyphomicrobium sp. TaxID=82 RepID=UPI001DDF569A|nr:hypothetical protein [Hyphomicrobium sp.]MBY0562512.1 hypothetical protein [Hyphomicrobium sp.]